MNETASNRRWLFFLTSLPALVLRLYVCVFKINFGFGKKLENLNSLSTNILNKMRRKGKAKRRNITTRKT
jgi:hypothetical protein